MSKESIIKDLPRDFVRQMRDWVKTGSCVGMYSMTSAYEGMPNSGTFGSRIPSCTREATHLERALEALPNRERCAVMLFWLYEGNDLVWLGRRLHCDYRTAEARVRTGHDLMRNDLARWQAAHERMLERLATGLLPARSVDNRKLQV
jgi:hypothetical protein